MQMKEGREQEMGHGESMGGGIVGFTVHSYDSRPWTPATVHQISAPMGFAPQTRHIIHKCHHINGRMTRVSVSESAGRGRADDEQTFFQLRMSEWRA